MPSQPDHFSAHLLHVLTAYQHGPFPVTVSVDEPEAVDETQGAVLVALEAMTLRMHTAESALAALRVSSAMPDLKDAPTPSQHTLCISCGQSSSVGEPLGAMTKVVTALEAGDFSRRVDTQGAHGEVKKLGDGVNALTTRLRMVVGQVERVAKEVGEGRIDAQAVAPGAQGVWGEFVSHVNGMSLLLANLVRSISAIVKAIGCGDFTLRMEVEAHGEILEMKETINMLGGFLEYIANEVTRVSLELGTEGILGSQAMMSDAWGSWRDMVNSINVMSNNLTHQIHTITAVITDVTHGDLRKISGLCARGDMLRLVEAINDMITQLRTFTSEIRQVEGGEGLQRLEDVWHDIAEAIGPRHPRE